jgi:hypothetical protein
MNKIKKFDGFDKLSENRTVNESKDWYVNNGYITDPSITNKEDLVKKVESEMTSAFVQFAKDKDIPVKNPQIEVSPGRRGTYVELKSDNIDDLGVFQNCFESAKFNFFSGREIQGSDVDGEFMFVPYIWSTLNISYQHKSGGSNGVGYVVEGERHSSDLWYDILEAKFYTANEYHNKTK